MFDPHASNVEQVHLWPMPDRPPSYLIHEDPPAISLRFGYDCGIRLPATAESLAYLRRLSAVVTTCADVMDEIVANQHLRARAGAHARRTVT